MPEQRIVHGVLGLVAFLSLFLAACGSDADSGGTADGTVNDSAEVDQILAADSSATDSTELIHGYRFTVTGDFDGDGRTDTLRERYLHAETGEEIDKYVQTEKEVRESSAGQRTRTLIVSVGGHLKSLTADEGMQSIGLAFLKNEGDLDGNGTDELSFVMNWGDMSSVNRYHVYTYRDTGWAELFNFMMHEWQLPPTPLVSAEYGMFGANGNREYEENDTLNENLEQQLQNFSLLEVIEPGVLRVNTNFDTETGELDVQDSVEHIVRIPPATR